MGRSNSLYSLNGTEEAVLAHKDVTWHSG